MRRGILILEVVIHLIFRLASAKISNIFDEIREGVDSPFPNRPTLANLPLGLAAKNPPEKNPVRLNQLPLRVSHPIYKRHSIHQIFSHARGA
jgi:hypothetical protein